MIASALLATVLMMAPAISAGPNGGWGKGLLSVTTEFHVDDSEVVSGFMYWSPETVDLQYDFHGYYLDAGTTYYLIAYEGTSDDEPEDYDELGSALACDYFGVHIKGSIPWPGLTDAAVCLVPETYEGFGGEDGWMPETYQVAGSLDLVPTVG